MAGKRPRARAEARQVELGSWAGAPPLHELRRCSAAAIYRCSAAGPRPTLLLREWFMKKSYDTLRLRCA